MRETLAQCINQHGIQAINAGAMGFQKLGSPSNGIGHDSASDWVLGGYIISFSPSH
jgi:hypothetical protein